MVALIAANPGMHLRAHALTVLATCLPLGALAAVDHGFPNVAYTLPPPVAGVPQALFIKGPIAREQGGTAIVAWHGERMV